MRSDDLRCVSAEVDAGEAEASKANEQRKEAQARSQERILVAGSDTDRDDEVSQRFYANLEPPLLLLGRDMISHNRVTEFVTDKGGDQTCRVGNSLMVLSLAA